MLEEMWKLSTTELRLRMAELAAEWDASQQPAPEPEALPPALEDRPQPVEGTPSPDNAVEGPPSPVPVPALPPSVAPPLEDTKG